MIWQLLKMMVVSRLRKCVIQIGDLDSLSQPCGQGDWKEARDQEKKRGSEVMASGQLIDDQDLI